MKTLYLVRHAKSSWKSLELADAERPLNKRGKRDAPFMAKLLRTMGVKLDVLMASPAARAVTTATIFAEKIKYPEKKILLKNELYEGDDEALVRMIQETDDSFQHVMLVGHNPALTTVVNTLCDAEIENIPTCGVVCVEFDITTWREVNERHGKLIFFEYPKLYFTNNEGRVKRSAEQP